MFKAIKALLSATNSALDVTTSVLNEVSNGLNSMNKSLESHYEKRKFLKELCRLIYENKLTKNEAIQQIQEKIGDEYISELDYDLERYCETECKTLVYKIFPIEQPTGLIEEYFLKNNEALFRKWLITKYGEISQKTFDNELKERRKYIINYLMTGESLSLSSRYALENLNNDELNIAFWNKLEEIKKKLREFEQKLKEFNTKSEQLFKSTGK